MSEKATAPVPPKAPTTWLAVFVIPPRDHPLATHAGPLIGYDVWTGMLYPDDEALWPGFTTEQVTRIRTLPRPYGVHVTISDALEYPARTVPTLIERLEAITAQVPPFKLTGVSYDQHFWDTVLALRWEAGVNDLHRLATTTAVYLNTLRARLPRVVVPPVTQPQMLRDWAIETTFGRHWTIEKYYPHLTLGNALEDRSERDRLWASWQRSGYLSQNLTDYNLDVDRVYLMTFSADTRLWTFHPDYPDGFVLGG
jgi:2'-5' RNA ligase